MAVTSRMEKQPGADPQGDTAEALFPGGTLVFEGSGRVLSISPEMARMLGRPIDNLAETLEDTDDFPCGRVLEVLRMAREKWVGVTRLATLERRHRHYVLVRTAPTRGPSGVERMAALVMDLTEALGESDLAGDFVRQVRHDLRGPLTSLRGAVDLLRTERVGRLEERQKKLIHLMDKSVQQMTDMLSGAPGGPLAPTKGAA